MSKRDSLFKLIKIFLLTTISFVITLLVVIGLFLEVPVEIGDIPPILFAVAVAFGLPLTFLINCFIKISVASPSKLVVLAFTLFLAGCGLGFASAVLYHFVPAGGWNQIGTPPEPLAKLVTTTPIHLLGDDVYGRTVSGTIYAYSCEWGKCTWTKQEVIPLLIDKDDDWWGKCYVGSQEPDWLVWKPFAPGKVIDSYAIRSCSPDGHVDTYFILLEDGTVWSWKTFWSVVVVFVQFIWSFMGGIVAVFVGLSWFGLAHKSVNTRMGVK